MNKFTFKLPDRLKLVVSRVDEDNRLCFSAKEDSTFVLNDTMIKDLLSCKSCNGSVDLNPPMEHSVTTSHYHLSFIDCSHDGILITLCKQNEKRLRNLHKCYMSPREFKKFIKVCKEVYKWEM